MSKADYRSSSIQAGQHETQNSGSSFRPQNGEHTTAAIAEESLARDLEDEELDNVLHDHNTHDASVLSRTSTQDSIVLGEHSLAGSYRRFSHLASGPGAPLGIQQPEIRLPVDQGREAAINEERALLQDNDLIQPSRPARRPSQASRASSRGLRQRISNVFNSQHRRDDLLDEEAGPHNSQVSETTALLGTIDKHSNPPTPPEAAESPEEIDKIWEDAVLSGSIQTTWQRETKVLVKYSAPLTLTWFLQVSLTLTSVFIVGHIGKNELGAVSLGSMTANITGYAIYHGMTTALDTLCAQAYGSGNKKLVGLALQRMVFFLWLITIPIAVLWYFGDKILMKIVPEKEIAVLAGQYLKILILGAPGYACFESAKRYVQAQGRFAATMYVFLFCAPLNVLMQWMFVYYFNWGFIGSPIAISITETLLPLLLLLYVRLTPAIECWPGFTRAAFRNWGPMIRLALPGCAMVVAEFLAFEILALASAQMSATHLATNTILNNLSIFTYQFPYPLSIAGSTRVANLIGAGLPEPAKCTARVMIWGGVVIGLFNMAWVMGFRNYIPRLYTNEPDVVELAAQTLPVNAAFQLFDSLAAQCNGLMRGIGQQGVGGIISLLAFYGIALPISFGAGFGLHWGLIGLWAGPAIGLFAQGLAEGIFICKTSWKKASEEAAKRNAAG